MNKIIGYFDEPGQTKPTYEPGLDVDCPICNKPLSMPIRSVSLMLPGDSRSFFYRMHKECSNDEQAASVFESSLIDGRADDLGIKSGRTQ